MIDTDAPNYEKDNIILEQIEKMRSDADKIQPDVMMEKYCEGLGQKDRDNYQYFNKIYKELCDKDLSFALSFISPDSLKSFIFYKLTDPENKQSSKICGNLFGRMYSFLYWSGYINFLEELGEIKILDKGKRKTYKEHGI